MRTYAIIAAFCLLSVSAFPDESTFSRDFGFQPLEIYEFQNGTSDLLVEDINHDGLDDIIFANNHVSRLELLVRKTDPADGAGLPELEERFENRGVLVDQGIRTIRIADLNGDDRKDIVTFGSTLGLLIRYQAEDGSFEEAERIFLNNTDDITTVQTGDLNGDQKTDILVCRKKQADLHWNHPDHPFREKKTLLFSSECRDAALADINRDDITDLVFFSSTFRTPLRARCGKGGGRYDTELPLDLPPRAYTALLEQPEQPAQIGMILRNRLAFRIYGFTDEEQPPLLQTQEASPLRIGLEGTDKRARPAWLATDVNADGFEDLIVSAPALNRLHLYRASPRGLDSEPERIDTLSEATHISQFANGDLLVVSKKEKIAGIHAAGALDTFPKIIKTPGDVLAGCAIPGTAQAWLVCKNKDGDLLLSQTDRSVPQSTHPLELDNDPNDLLAFSLPDNQTGLLLFMPYDSPRFFLFNETGLSERSSESFRALTHPLIRSNIHLDQPGDGSRLTVATGSVARQFKWQDDRYTITRQFNPENADAQLAASTEYALLDGSRGTLIYDPNAEALIGFGNTGTRFEKIHIPDADPTLFDLVQLKNKSRDTILLIGRTGLSEILSNGSRLTLTSKAEYVSPAEKPKLASLRPVELGAPPRPMFALVDPANRSLELVSRRGDELKTELVFEVYLSSDFVNRKQKHGTEPHDLHSGDLNGDGIGDLILLCQDKLLIYLGE